MKDQLNLFNNKQCRVVHFKKSSYDVYIGRPSEFGNPFEIGKDGTRKEVIEKYRKYFYGRPDLMEKAKKELTGKIIACWCKPKSCHGDVLAEYVNRESYGQGNS